MGTGLGVIIDRRVAALIVLRLRRHWPLLKLVPALWMRPIVTPGARRRRRALARGIMLVAAAATAGVALVVVIVQL